MWLIQGRATGRKNSAPLLSIMVKLKRGHCTAHGTVLAAPQRSMVKDKSEEESQTAVRFDPINDGELPDVLQLGRAVMARRRRK